MDTPEKLLTADFTGSHGFKQQNGEHGRIVSGMLY